MTFKEVKDLLLDIRYSKQRARQMNKQIEEYISINSSLGHQSLGRGKGCVHSPIEQIVLRIEKEQEGLAKALQKVFDLEDKLAEALETLTPVERDIIVGCYMQSRTHWKLANELNYSEQHIRRLKRTAIQKIADNYKDERK